MLKIWLHSLHVGKGLKLNLGSIRLFGYFYTFILYAQELFTPLHLSSYHGNLDAVKILLEHGADPNKANKVLRYWYFVAIFVLTIIIVIVAVVVVDDDDIIYLKWRNKTFCYYWLIGCFYIFIGLIDI